MRVGLDKEGQKNFETIKTGEVFEDEISIYIRCLTFHYDGAQYNAVNLRTGFFKFFGTHNKVYPRPDVYLTDK